MSIEETIRSAVRDAVDEHHRREVLPLLQAMQRQLTHAVPQRQGTVEQAAEVLGKHPDTIRELCREGRLPAQRVGRTWRINLAELQPVSEAEVVAAVRKARR